MSVIELTPIERAEVEQYCKELAAEISTMDGVEIGILAERAQVDAEKFPERAHLEAAIEEKARADFIKGKVELREMTETQNKRADEEDRKRTAEARVLHALNREFSRIVPATLHMFVMPELPENPTQEDLRREKLMQRMIGHWVGSYCPPRGDPSFGGEYAVPNGKYRVAGSPFIFEFKSRRLVEVRAANPDNDFGGEDVKAVN